MLLDAYAHGFATLFHINRFALCEIAKGSRIGAFDEIADEVFTRRGRGR